MEVKIDPVQILTVKDKIQLFKGEESANSIELIQFEENGFEVVAQKDLYKIGEKAIYIQPDYSIPDTPLFESYIRPSKGNCKLGSNNRIRAIKFNLHRGDSNPVYSQGILLPIVEVLGFLRRDNKIIELHQLLKADLTKELGITKWESPEGQLNGMKKSEGGKSFPSWAYRTDETNINNLWNYIEKSIGYPITLVGTLKEDGSSITIGYKQGFGGFICSRNLLKPLTIRKTVGKKSKTLLQKLLFWKRFDLNIYQEQENTTDDFVRYGKPLLGKVEEYCKFWNEELIIRGELNGSIFKGSGNKNNPSKNEAPNIKAYSLDKFENGNATKDTYNNFKKVCNQLDIITCKEIFNKSFNSRQEIEDTCNEYFKTNIIEGIVVRTLDSKFSAKFMNCHYDSLK